MFENQITRRKVAPYPPFCIHWLLGLGLLVLAGCDNSNSGEEDKIDFANPTPEQLAVMEANTTLSAGFGTPRANGTFSGSLATIFKGGFKDDEGNGYAFELGRDETAFSARVGLLQGSDVGDLPNSGLATMRGAYQVAEVGKSQGDNREYGEPLLTTGRITLRADFEYGTLQGDDGTLNVDGVFSGKTLTGNAYFNARPADLAGQVGGERAIGIFQGTDDASTFAGGFLVTR